MNKTAIKNFAIWARNKLIADVRYRAGLLGITAEGIKPALPQSTRDAEFYDIGTGTPHRVSGPAVEQRRRLAEAIRAKERDTDYLTAYRCITEEVAYTWFNRLIALRFMEVNDYLPGHVRVLSSESGKLEPDLVTDPFSSDLAFTPEEADAALALRRDNKTDELFRMLFLMQCNALNKPLPALFERTHDYTELLLNLSVVDQEGVVYHLVHDIPEEDFNIQRGGQVEIIGWLYQYYNTEPKAEVFARPSGTKIRKEDIPAATQLFTPDWIVRYMVENSLGRLWLEGHPDDGLRSSWRYYLDEAEQDPPVAEQLAALRQEYAALSPEDIRCMDPCAGSGHILVYMFDVLMQIYQSRGYSPRDAAQKIVEHNLYGLDIDRRAAQMAYFALMMKARQYDRRFFSRGIQPQVYCTGTDPEGAEYGSLLLVDDPGPEPEELTGLEGRVDSFADRENSWQVRCALAQRFHVVCTNPPYMGGSGMGGKLAEYVKRHFPDSKADLFACFMERADSLVMPHGFTSLITMESWMFLSSFEKLREKVNRNKTIINMVHMPYLGKGGTSLGINFGTAAVIMLKGRINNYSAQYEYTVYYETDDEGVPLVFPTINERWKTAKQEDFSKIPGAPVAYWVSENLMSDFASGKPIESFSDPKKGLTTSNDACFLRLWSEVCYEKICFYSTSMMPDAFWVPLNKGGEFRKWYGNDDYVINWAHNGSAVKSFSGSVIRNEEYYFREAITWNDITTKCVSMRFKPVGFIFNDAGPCIFSSEDTLLYLLGFGNSIVMKMISNIIAPTIHYTVGQMASVPILFGSEKQVNTLVKENITLSRADWDAFETSWDFQRHPLLPPLPEGGDN